MQIKKYVQRLQSVQKSQIWLLTKYVDFCCSCCRCCISSTRVNTSSVIELYESQNSLDHIPIQSHSRSPNRRKTQGGGSSNPLLFHPLRNAVSNIIVVSEMTHFSRAAIPVTLGRRRHAANAKTLETNFLSSRVIIRPYDFTWPKDHRGI